MGPLKSHVEKAKDAPVATIRNSRKQSLSTNPFLSASVSPVKQNALALKKELSSDEIVSRMTKLASGKQIAVQHKRPVQKEQPRTNLRLTMAEENDIKSMTTTLL